MLELGYFSKKLHIQAAKTINKSKINKVYAYGKDIKFTFDMIKTQKKGMMYEPKRQETLHHRPSRTADSGSHPGPGKRGPAC